jgi:hypothetical protein
VVGYSDFNWTGCLFVHIVSRMRQDKSAFVGAQAEREEMERKRTERAKRRKECQEKLVVPHPMHARLSHALVVARAIIPSWLHGLLPRGWVRRRVSVGYIVMLRPLPV